MDNGSWEWGLSNAKQCTMKPKDKNEKKFIPYRTRPIRLSNKTWEKLKAAKVKFDKNWDSFIQELLK